MLKQLAVLLATLAVADVASAAAHGDTEMCGYLIDIACLNSCSDGASSSEDCAMDGTNPFIDAAAHTKSCLAMGVCKASGYVLMSKDKTDGAHTVIAILDAAANELAISNIVDIPGTPSKGVLVTITGVAAGDATAAGKTTFEAPEVSIEGIFNGESTSENGDAIADAIGDALGPDCAGAEFAALLASCTGCDENGGNIGTDACPVDCISLGACFDNDDGDDDDFEMTPELFAALIPQYCAADCGDEIAACGGDSFNAGCMEALAATLDTDGIPPTSSSDFLALFQCVESASCMPEGDDDDDDDDDDDGAAVQAFVVDQIVANTDLDQSAATALVTGIAANLDLPDDFDFTTIFENDVVVAALTANGVSATEIEAMDSAAESTDFDELTSGGNDSTGGGSNPGGGGDDDDDSAASAAVGLATVVGLAAALF